MILKACDYCRVVHFNPAIREDMLYCSVCDAWMTHEDVTIEKKEGE